MDGLVGWSSEKVCVKCEYERVCEQACGAVEWQCIPATAKVNEMMRRTPHSPDGSAGTGAVHGVCVMRKQVHIIFMNDPFFL